MASWLPETIFSVISQIFAWSWPAGLLARVHGTRFEFFPAIVIPPATIQPIHSS